jgi:DNA-binding transcriptional ArsR family regulator
VEKAVDNRLAALERRVAALESAHPQRKKVLPDELEPAATTADVLAARTADVLAADWAARASTLAALGNPVRLTLLREILHGRTTVNALSEVDGLGTTGQIYHHLRQLTAEDWLHTPSRGVFAVPQSKRVALLAILVALET